MNFVNPTNKDVIVLVDCLNAKINELSYIISVLEETRDSLNVYLIENSDIDN